MLISTCGKEEEEDGGRSREKKKTPAASPALPPAQTSTVPQWGWKNLMNVTTVTPNTAAEHWRKLKGVIWVLFARCPYLSARATLWKGRAGMHFTSACVSGGTFKSDKIRIKVYLFHYDKERKRECVCLCASVCVCVCMSVCAAPICGLSSHLKTAADEECESKKKTLWESALLSIKACLIKFL